MTSICRTPWRVVGRMPVAAAFAAVLLCAATATARVPAIQFPAAEKTVANPRSEVYAQKEKEALVLWKAGSRDEAKTMLYRQSTDAPPADAAAAKLRLGYMSIADKDDTEAKRLFEAVADMPSGVNDAVKAEGAERLAYIAMRDKQYDACRTRFHRLLSGEYEITNEKAADICFRLGSLERRLNNYQAGVPYYEAMESGAANPSQRAWARSGLAGLWLDMANGDGVPQLPVEERPAAREKARFYCQAILAEVGPEPGKVVPLDREMIAELMYSESYYFAKDYDRAYELGAAFLAHWGTNTAAYEDNNMKIYVNTAKPFHAMNAYFAEHYEESLALAEDLVANPPPAKEHFSNFDAYMYACVCGTLSAQALGRSADAARFEGLGRAYNAGHFDGLYPSIAQDAVKFVAAKRASAQNSVAQSKP